MRGGGKTKYECMKVFLVGGGSRWAEVMKLYLAGEHPVKNGTKAVTWKGINILESYYYARGNKWFPRLYSSCENFLLDSGAFTFMSGNHRGSINWDEYTESYADFINQYNIEKFFELDIDIIVGIKEVERLRERLEVLTGKKPIPVWHKNRGKDYFVQMCQSYPYVAVGGIVTKEIPRSKYEQMFPWFIQTAHKHGARIHGLGYTNIEGLHKYHFDSVDSSAWLFGNRSGYVNIFSNGTMVRHKRGEGEKVKSHETACLNFSEWVKFSKYADLYL